MLKIGLNIFFFFLISFTTICAQELTIYAIPAPRKVNWKSPGKLVKSSFINTIVSTPYGKYRHPIGHMVVELQDSTRYELVGMAAEKSTIPRDKVMKEGYGLGVLFSVIDGKLEHKDYNLPDVKARIKNGDIAFINYKISQETFDRLWNYLTDYQTRGYDKLYNGNNKPREGTGSGCSAFAISFLEVGGLKSLLPSEEWKINVAVPEKYIGGPHCDDRKIKFLKILFARKWADTTNVNEPYELLSLYEPTKLYNWIQEKHNSSINYPNVYKSTRGKAKGLTVNVWNNISPTEPIWYVRNDN